MNELKKRSDNFLNQNDLTRKKFLQSCGIVAGGVMLYPMNAVGASSVAESAGENAHWYAKPLRILQTVLRETDAESYDADAVVEYMKEAGCNMLVVNAGGIVDFFQNPLPVANINPFMGDRDIVQEITNRCKEEGIRVIVRVDFRGVEPHIYEKHKEWFSINHDGTPQMLGYTRPDLHNACYTGYYRNEHAEEFIRYLMTNYDLDGIWHNSIGVIRICHCDRCSRSFREFAGKDLPIEGESSDEELAEYMVWKEKVADEHMEHMKQTVKSFGEDKVYTAEVFNMFYGTQQIDLGIDLYNARDHFDFLVSVAFLTPNQEHITYEDLSYAGSIVKFLKSMKPEKEAIILYGGNGTAHRYIKDAPVDLEVWLWHCLAAGGRFWNCNFTGMHPNATHDRRNAYNNNAAYFFVKEYENLLAHHTPVMPIGIYYSKATRQFYSRETEAGDRFDLSIKGTESVLIENHISYGFIADDQATLERLQKHEVLILPNVRCLSDREADIFRSYVEEGGKLIATFATGLFDEMGNPRDNFVLADLFGCDYTGEMVNTRRDCYQYITDPEHPIVKKHAEGTELFVNSGYTALCDPSDSAHMVCSYTPLVHNQPPEKAWAEAWESKHPTLLVNRYGRGEVVYFANQPDQSSYELGHPDLRNLFNQSVAYLADKERIPVSTNAPASVHVGLTQSLEKPGSYIFSLVNTTSGPQRPLRELLPVSNVEVKLNLENSNLKNYDIMKAQGDCIVDSGDGRINLKISRLVDYFSIHLEV